MLPENQNNHNIPSPSPIKTTTNRWQFKLGIFLIILSALFYASILTFPFLNLSVSAKLSLTTIVVITGEILFWIGGFLIGKELLSKIIKKLNPKNLFAKHNNLKQE